MKIQYYKGNVLNQEEVIAHCISFDCAMGAGIAKQIRFHYKGIRETLKTCIVREKASWPTAIYYTSKKGSVINLVTKEKYFQKPTYETLTMALKEMETICKTYQIETVAMPKIGCGLDRLEWSLVEPIIMDVFKDSNITIQVYEL